MRGNPSVAFRCLASSAVLAACAIVPTASATIVGLNQIVTPEIQPRGVLTLSAQAEHSYIGNSQQLQLELGVTPRFEVAWFQGLKPSEGLFSTEFNLVQSGPHLLTVGVINWSTLGGKAQPVIEYGCYTEKDRYVAGVIQVAGHDELLLGYKRLLTDRVAFSTDFQSGPGNSATVGLTYNFNPDLSLNPALYWTNSSRHHLLGYVVLSYNLTLWK